MTDQMDKESTCRAPVVWGTVYDDFKRPLSGRQVRLLQCKEGFDSCFLLVGQTYSDCNGYYEIPIPSSCRGNFRIEVCNTEEKQVQRRGHNNICYY